MNCIVSIHTTRRVAGDFGKEALRLFDAYEQIKTAKLDSLRQDIAKGLNDAANGRAEEIDLPA